MKKTILSLTAFAALFSVNASAQLVSSLNISTGYDNVSHTTIPYVNNDDDWLITNLTPPFVPYSSYDYPGLVQAPWYISGVTSPIILPGSGWISYNPTSMTVGPYDNIGGHIFFEYRFTTCAADVITLHANVLCDNGLTNFYVDGVNTGFTMNPYLSSNWNPGSSTSYSASLPAGTHTIDIEVANVGTGQPNNPAGLDLSGVLTSPHGVLVDHDNFPNYHCLQSKMLQSVGNLDNTNRTSSIEQNTPNPFNGSTQIKYFISGLQPNTFISVTDINGRTLMTYPITGEGEGSITIGNLAPGTYLYSLNVNGRVIDSKRMIMNK
ncbi:MAG: T9SS type A sorting domain-containing protein [Flavipsychrobacter sp.]